MLRVLKYKATFSSTGKTLENKLTFERGFGAIIGPNESGKSMVIEMIRYALFGTAALRAPLASYTDLEVFIQFDVRGERYWLERSLKSCTLSHYKDEKLESLAVGTKPVNVKVVQVLGFGLDVFDISCVAMQGEIEKLGTMTPAERKRMVDSVIGMSVIEDLIKLSNDEANAKKRDASNREANLRKPQKPSPPINYVEDHRRVFEQSLTIKSEYDRLVGLTSVVMVPPVKPVEPIMMSVENLEKLHHEWSQAHNEVTHLTHWVSEFVHPKYTADQLLEMNEAYNALDNRKQIEAQIEYHESLMMDAVTCPTCKTEFHPQHANLPELIEDLRKALGNIREVEAPPLRRPQIAIEFEKLQEVEVYNQKVVELEEAKVKFSKLKNHSNDLQSRRFYERDLISYKQDNNRYLDWVENHKRNLARLAELKIVVDNHAAVFELHQACQEFDTLSKVYEREVAAYEVAIAEVDLIKKEEEDWTRATEALRHLRVLIKQHLLPSLNTWSSRLLSLMTGGSRTSIVVNDDFDITVDGQPLATLSGSGKAVANLAIRIGLGQVLTNGVFSLFVGDEIDASMDKDRAENTANALQTLKDYISQILLVSHKLPAADYYINLGNTDDQPNDTAD